MDPEELELLPAQQTLGASAIAAYGLALGSISSGLPTWAPLLLGMALLLALGMLLAPGRLHVVRIAAIASGVSTVLWIVVTVMAPIDHGVTVIHAFGLGGIGASALTADFLWRLASGRTRHEFSSPPDGPQGPPASPRRRADPYADGAIEELDGRAGQRQLAHGRHA